MNSFERCGRRIGVYDLSEAQHLEEECRFVGTMFHGKVFA